MSHVTHAIATFCDWILSPLVRLQPLVAMVLVSLVTCVLVLIVYKYTSRQASMVRVKDRIKASFLSISLYKDSLRVIATASLRITRDNLHYMALNVIPLLVMIGPVSLVMVQLDGWFGYRPVQVGEQLLVTATLDEGTAMDEDIDLMLPAGIVMDAPVVRIPSENEVSWRVEAEKEGDHVVTLQVGDRKVEKELPVGDEPHRISLVRHAGGIENALMHPGESPIDVAGVQSIRVDFEGAEMDIFGWGVHWLWVFFALTMVLALALRDLFKVTF